MYIINKKIRFSLVTVLLLLCCTQLNGMESVTITSPADSSTLTTAPLSITGTSSMANRRVKLTLNTTVIGTPVTDGSGNWNFTLNSLFNGIHSLTAQLLDPNFEVLATDINAFTMDMPSITITSPEESEIIFLNPAHITGTTSASSGLVNVLLDGTLVATTTADTNGAWDTTYTVTSNGTHTLVAQLIVAASPVASSTVGIISQIPVTNVLGGSNIYTNTSGLDITVFLDGSPTVTGIITTNSGLRVTSGGITSTGGIDSTGATILHSLGAGIVNTNAGGVVTSSATTNHGIQVGNASGTLSSLPLGSNGQVLLAALNADPAFATLTSTGNSVQFITGTNALNIESTPIFGKVLRVDSVYGNNTTAFRNGLPYSTINGAIAAAQSGDAIWIFPGTYAESFTIPNNVVIRGLSSKAVTIAQTVSTATDLVTMGENSRLEDLTLTLSSNSHVQLRGIVFPGATSATANVRNIALTVDNSGASIGGTSNVYAIHSTGTGQPTFNTAALRASTLTVNSTGNGSKRGILVDAANTFNIRETSIGVTNSGAGISIGVETNHASAAFSARTSTISGSFADISRTLGTITLSTTDLIHANANSLSFTTDIEPSTIAWAFSGNAPGNGTYFMRVGSTTPAAAAMSVIITEPVIVKSLSVSSRVAPSVAVQNTWTVFKNGSATPLTVSLGIGEFSAINTINSVSFTTGDLLSLQYLRAGGGANIADVVVTMDLY